MKLPSEGILNSDGHVSWWSVWHHLPSEDKDGLFDGTGYPESMVLSNPLSQPVVEAKVLVNQKASHFDLLSLLIPKIMPNAVGQICLR
jgi:hypothetical protein